MRLTAAAVLYFCIVFGVGFLLKTIVICAVGTLIATASMKDYTGKDIEGEYE